MQTEQLIRSAYVWKFNKDIPERSLKEDTHDFNVWGKVPPYLTAYIIHLYGVQ
jgi:hypothetical protein